MRFTGKQHAHRYLVAVVSVLALVCTAAALPACAQPGSAEPAGAAPRGVPSSGAWDTTASVSFNLGAGNKYQRASLAYQTPTLWRMGRAHVVAEFAVSYWRAHGARRHPDTVWQFGTTPFVRWSPDDYFYLEAGLGANAFSRSRFARRNLGTAFQFGEHIGVGWRFVGGGTAGARWSHYSNAGIKNPSSGLNVVQLYYRQPF